jgi:hypothetical protein
MPFKPAPESQVPIKKYIPADLQGDDPSVVDIAAALWRTENTIGSYLNQEKGLPDEVGDRSYNPYDFMSEEEKSDKQFVVNAALAESEDELNAVRRQQARERKDRETIANGGAISVALGLGVGFTDPVNFIPIGGAVARTYKTGGSILKSAAVTGSVTAASTAIQEAALHATQLERTYGESAVNVGAGAFLGGVLGFGVGKLAQYIDERQIKEMAKSMEPETRILAGEDSVILSTPEIGVTAKVVDTDAADDLLSEISAFSQVTEDGLVTVYHRTTAEKAEIIRSSGHMTPKEDGLFFSTSRAGQAEGFGDEVIEMQIPADRLFLDDLFDGEAHLRLPAAANKPNSIQEYLVPTGDELAVAKPGQTPSLQQQAADEGISAADLSAGAMQVANGEEVKGKVGKFLVKALSFDPLSRTITSANPFTRTLANLLAENPIAMDRGGVTAVESRIKIKDGRYNTALANHLDQFRAYKKAGGNLSRVKFNEAVARALRNDASDIPEALESARSWRSNLYDPLKNEAIEVGLLPEDVDVTTAVGYLNRRWNKDKIVANYDEFLSVVSKWLKDKDIELRAEAERARLDVESATGAEKTRLQAIIEKSDFKEQLDLEDMEYEDIARQIAQRIKGSPDGRLPYDWKIGEGSSGNKLNGTPMRGPLRSRTFQIPDNLVEDFLENNIEDLGRIYLRQIAPDIEIKRQFPDDDIELSQEIGKIEKWYSDAMKMAKTKREKALLEKAKNSDIEDIAGMRDRMRGVYAMEDPDNIFHRAGRVARNLNYLRLMGGVVASSVPDVARIFMAEGIGKTFSKGLVPLAKNLKTFQVSAAEGKRYGIGVDALMGGRSQIISDISDYTKGGTKFERGVQSLTDNFGRINLMDYWTTAVKQLHVVTMQNSVVDGLLKGKVDKRLSRLGIDDGNASAIAEQLKKYAEKVDGVWLSNAKNWDNPELEQIWGAALRKESDRVIVVPGQEKPLFMSTPMGKTILQFRSFMFASTQRMTIAALQGQDHNALGGVLMLTTLGMMSYAFKQKDAGREITDDPIALVIEGIDRSGALGGIMEINNTMEKISSNNFGLRPLLGADLPAARFASRSIADGLMGPTFGSGIDLVARVANAGLGEDDWTESDTRALRRLLPGQNLTFIRNGLDKVEKEIGDL